MQAEETSEKEMKTICVLLLVAILDIAGCHDEVVVNNDRPNKDRPVATTYKIKTNGDADTVQCFRIQNTEISQLTTLKKDQLVDIVAVEQGLRRFDGQLWLNIYPKLTHRPSCYVNINNLIPYS